MEISAPSARPLVVIDPGHGGEKPGTVSDDGVPEKELALAIAQKLEALLAAEAVTVRLTRSDDSHVDLKDRIQLANDLKAAAFMSIHLNAMPSRRTRLRVRGVETFFLAKKATGEHAEAVADAENAEDKPEAPPVDDLAFILADLAETEAHQDASQFAYAVHERMAERLPTRDRGVHQAPFRVLKGALMPAILVEVGYLSHPDESTQLKDPEYQDRIARALHQGIMEFLVRKGLVQGFQGDGASPAPQSPDSEPSVQTPVQKAPADRQGKKAPPSPR